MAVRPGAAEALPMSSVAGATARACERQQCKFSVNGEVFRTLAHNRVSAGHVGSRQTYIDTAFSFQHTFLHFHIRGF